MELPGGGDEWLVPSPSPPGPAVPDRHDEHGMGTFIWPPVGTSTWPPVGTFSWPRTPELTSIISISVRTTCVRDFGCLILARAGSTTSPIPNRSAPGNRQSKLQFAQPPTFQTSGHAVHPVRKRVELRLVGRGRLGISGGAPRRWPSSASHTPPDAFGRGRFCRSKAVQEAVSASGDFQWELAPCFA
jgi:hypothetical protein